MTSDPLPGPALDFAATPRPRRLAAVAVLAVLAAVASGHGELLIVAVAPLILLVLSPRSALPTSAHAAVSLEPTRCVEGDELTLALEVGVPGADRVELVVVPPPRVEVHHDTAPVRAPGPPVGASTTVRLVPRRWGRYRDGRVRLRVVAGNGMYAATVTLTIPELVVYPGGGLLARPVAPRELPARFGEHASRAIGSGVEFAGVRPYASGDRRRDIDWRTTARRQELHVRQYAAERPVDVVLVLDVDTDAGEPGHSTLDLSVRGALVLASTYLAVADRIGLVTLGRSVRWLAPAAGPRQRQRLADALMQVRLDDSQVGGGIDRLPPAALPGGAFVCLFSPLLDDRAVTAVRDLRGRGFGVLVVDVLTSEPVEARSRRSAAVPAGLALRVWRLGREADRAELAGLGVPLMPWDGTGDLASALLHAMRAVRPEVRA